MEAITIAFALGAYLFIGYIIGVYAAYEDRARIPFSELSRGGKLRRFLLYPASVYGEEKIAHGVLEGESIVVFSTFLWPLRYFPIFFILGREFVMWPLMGCIYIIIIAPAKVFGWILGKFNPKLKYPGK